MLKFTSFASVLLFLFTFCSQALAQGVVVPMQVRCHATWEEDGQARSAVGEHSYLLAPDPYVPGRWSNFDQPYFELAGGDLSVFAHAMVKVLPRGRLELCQTALQVTRVLGEPSRIPWSITGGSVLDYDGKCKSIEAGAQVAVNTFSIFETTYFASCSYKIQSPRRRVESTPIN